MDPDPEELQHERLYLPGAGAVGLKTARGVKTACFTV